MSTMTTTLGGQLKALNQKLKDQAISEKAKQDALLLKKELQEKADFKVLTECCKDYLRACIAEETLPRNIVLNKSNDNPLFAQVNWGSSIMDTGVGHFFSAYEKPYYKQRHHLVADLQKFTKEMEEEGIKIQIVYGHDGVGINSWSEMKFIF